MDQAPLILELVTKGGVSGILILIICVLAAEVVRLRKQSTKLFFERDGYRLRYVLYKAECDRANIKVDTSALAPIVEPVT